MLVTGGSIALSGIWELLSFHLWFWDSTEKNKDAKHRDSISNEGSTKLRAGNYDAEHGGDRGQTLRCRWQECWLKARGRYSTSIKL